MEYISAVYYPYACLVCLQSQADIKRCSNCKIVAYCSPKHQKLDWRRSHKDLCKVINACDKNFTPSINNFQEWTVYRLGRENIWSRGLNRELNMQETIMNHFSPRCAVCYTKQNLYCCKNCLNVSYCSDSHELQHLGEHQKFCDSFKLSLITDQYVNLKGQPYVKFNPIDNNKLTCTNDILKYLELADFNRGHSFLTQQEELQILDVIKTERIVLGLNLLNTLRFIKFTSEKLVVHIVGASNLEEATDWSVVTNIILNWTNYTYIIYHFIGPDVYKSFADVQQHYKAIYHSCLYHEILDQIDKPDLVAAFNCGLHEYTNNECNTWTDSIPKLLFYKNVPLMLTSFTKDELNKDIDILLRINPDVNIIQDVKRNPFAFLKPLRDWASEDEPIFYRCNYLCIAEKN